MRRGRLRDLATRPHLPQRTVRLRLTALYSALFLPLGVALIIITAVVTFLSLHPSSLHPIAQKHEHGKTIVVPSGGAGGTTVAPQTTYTSAHSISTFTSSSSARLSR